MINNKLSLQERHFYTQILKYNKKKTIINYYFYNNYRKINLLFLLILFLIRYIKFLFLCLTFIEVQIIIVFISYHTILITSTT